ncbi:aminoglycoside phosphotransferase family protein [Paenibacillus eucommiae]|uniref:Aminoglycoside phosphotransferase (APT) family kinase protein n=1 Tax=Paenibacillus eucommiae TaxID=1355755 RepID=A0ABS4ISQ9_9BACL|nr:aminoglycoside phosphotransferase family protein [Paenibacillus eucommiae]MBP1990609.1 aminoglycoside phosphotransferase (APT) family kinase protein [Paenibacillus eucommiae]
MDAPNLISQINWMEKSDSIDHLSELGSSLLTFPLESGLEAEVLKIGTEIGIELAGPDDKFFVLKTWSKSSKPDINYQFHLLQALSNSGLPVSKPLGWGVNDDSHSVLLTSFAGTPLLKVNPKKIAEIAIILSNIHKLPLEKLEHQQIRLHDFNSYFFPEIHAYPDLNQAITHLLKITPIQQDHLIHGDFNLMNILENNGQYAVIDWTNGQLGDPRYDLAWSCFLLNIYVTERISSLFLAAYLSENPYSSEELEVFEALACIRWILLDRTVELAKRPDTAKRVKHIIKNNVHLNEQNIEI